MDNLTAPQGEQPVKPPVDPCAALEADSEIEIDAALRCAITLLERTGLVAAETHTAHGRVVWYATSFVISALRTMLEHLPHIGTADDIPF